jgi:hypothetical protein
MKWSIIVLLSVMMVCLLAMPAVADYNSDGWPVVTRVNGTINGSVFIDSESDFQTSTTLNTIVPAGTVKYAYLYTGVWGGTNSYTGWMNVTFNGNSTSNGLGPIHLEGTSDTNPNVWCTGSGKYWMWYNVTNLTLEGSNTATTSKINSTSGTFDGRVYGIVLVVVLENQSEPMIQYWINDGSDGLNYNTPHDVGTAYFNGTVSTSNVVGSALTMVHLTADLASCTDCLEFNGHPLSTGMISEFFEMNIWDETNSNVKPENVTSSGNNVWYSRGTDQYANVCNAILVLGLEDEGDVLEFGDATDPTYPSLLASDGARHSPTNTECLGLNISGSDWKDFESNAKVSNLDVPFDDGLVNGNIVANSPAQTVTFEVSELNGTQNLIANILIDLNRDGDWNDAGEHVVVNQPINISNGDGVVVSTPFSTAGAVPGQTWMRITLTRSPINPGWDGTMIGFAQMIPFEYGETEDWEVYIEEEGQPDPDLIVESVSINPNCKHYYFANEPNVVNVTVKNIGTAAAGASNTSVSGASGTSVAPVGALDPGQSQTVTITDTVARPAGEVVTATADCYGEVTESNETNNVYSIIDPDGNNHVINHGFKGKWLAEGYAGPDPGNMTTWKSYEFHGDLNYSVGDSAYLSDISVAWDTYTANWTAGDLPIPNGATVVEARLYVYYTWDRVNVMPDNVSMSFNGANQDPYDVHYTDRRGYGTVANYNLPYGALVYNVTDDFNRTSNHAVLNKTIPSATQQVAMRGMMLLVVYEDPTEPLRQIFVIEEFDNLYGEASYCTTPDESTALALFTGPSIDMGTMANANLITIVNGAGPNEGDLIFNGQTWTNVWNFAGTTELGIDERSVKDNLTETDNAVGFQSNGDWMEASNAFLVVEYGEQTGTCGDVDGIPGVTTNDGWFIYMNQTFPGDPTYFVNTVCADCDGPGYPGVTTNDGWFIYMNQTFPGNSIYMPTCSGC